MFFILTEKLGNCHENRTGDSWHADVNNKNHTSISICLAAIKADCCLFGSRIRCLHAHGMTVTTVPVLIRKVAAICYFI